MGDGKLCENVISYADMILDCNRRWTVANGTPERAMFMNSLCDASFYTQNYHEHRLAQGPFDMADVHCKLCSWQVGYAFLRDKSDEQQNINQVGRFGLVCSRVRLGPGLEVYVDAGCQRLRHTECFQLDSQTRSSSLSVDGVAAGGQGRSLSELPAATLPPVWS